LSNTIVISANTMNILYLRLLVAMLAALAGCAALPPHVPSPPVHALTDVAATRLARIAAACLPPGKETLSGFRLLPEGETAFQRAHRAGAAGAEVAGRAVLPDPQRRDRSAIPA
jgi:hypothetical protein